MKKSNRYATRYTAKMRRLKAEWKSAADGALTLIQKLERQRDFLKAELDRARAWAAESNASREPGVTTIRIGKALPGFRGKLLALQVAIDVEQWAYLMHRNANSRTFTDVSQTVRYHCRDVAAKMEAAMMEYLQKEQMV